jgi:hypothetical protein
MSEEDFEFGDKLPGLDQEIAPERWERVRNEIVFKDLAEEILSRAHLWHMSGNKINCPFHGSDSTPSFTFYDESNSASCFGCPGTPKDQFYDNVNFIAKYFGINKVAALQWLEKHFKLPPIAGQPIEPDEEEEEDEEESDPFTVKDLAPVFLTVAPTLIETVEDAKYLIKKYFLALHLDDPLFLARVLGRKRLESIRLSGRVSNEGTGRSNK